jgi:D,D-heptose 1,7-bisphosphate phosphatase
MQAVILAGGKGTRLGHFTSNIPKPMVKIGDVPILEHQLLLLKRHLITDIIIVTNYLKDIIRSYFGNGDHLGISINYYEESNPLGTAGAIKEIEDMIQGDFLLLYGDIMLDMDLNRFIAFHQALKGYGTLVVHPTDHPQDSDLVTVNAKNQITSFASSHHDSKKFIRNLASAGVFIFSKEVFKFLQKDVKSDLGRDVLPTLCKKILLFSYNTSEYLKDMGTPERLAKVTKDFHSGKIKTRSLVRPQKAIFLDRDGVLNKEVGLIFGTNDLEVFTSTPRVIKKINESDFLAIVVTNQSVIARNLCSEEELQEIHAKLETVISSIGAKLDAIYYCPHHPDKGFQGENTELKILCECRKPRPGMLLKAAEDFNLTLADSYFIGNESRDVEAGKRAGVCTIGLLSDEKTGSWTSYPDYFFFNAEEAVDFILADPYRGVIEMIKSLIKKSKRPLIITIGGNPMSGKTILIRYLMVFLRLEGIKTGHILTNDQIIPYNNSKLVQSIDHLSEFFGENNQTFETQTGYLSEINEWYQHEKPQIVFIEGRDILHHKHIRELSDLLIFKTLAPQIMVDRINRLAFRNDFYANQAVTESLERLEFINRTANYSSIIL